MRKIFRYAFVAVLVSFLGQGLLWGQACKDEQDMVDNYQKDLVASITEVKNESQQDFEKKYHQKCILTNLTLFSGILGDATDCLTKAETDATATKDQVAAYKAKHDSLAKVKGKVDESAKGLKAETDSRKAKEIIQKIEFSD